MTRLLLAGTGLIGHRHLRHIEDHPNLTLAGIIDPAPKATAPSGAPVFASVDEVNVEADGVVIATPTSTHAPLALAAMDRGWHALVEKPITDTPENAAAIIARSEATGLHVLVGHHRRYHPCVSKLKDILGSGRLGRPVAASLLWLMRKPDDYFDIPWRAGMDGAPVKQNLIHDVDLLRFFFGDVVQVCGIGSNMVRGAARTESGGAVLGFESGMTVTIAFADTTPTPWGFEAGTGESPAIPRTRQNSLYIACTNGAIEFPSLRIWSGAQTWNEAPVAEETEVEETVPLIRQLEHFADVIAGRAAPIITARDGRDTLLATLQIEAATRPGGVAP